MPCFHQHTTDEIAELRFIINDEDRARFHELERRCGLGLRKPAHLLLEIIAAIARRHSGNSKLNPAANNREGTTRRLFNSNSVSVRKKNAPTSSIQRAAGNPMRTPHSSRKIRMNSPFGSGFGAQRFTAPENSCCVMSHATARVKSVT